MQSERFRKVTLTAADFERLTVLDAQHSFDGDGRLLRLGLQAYALGIAYEPDPCFPMAARAEGEVRYQVPCDEGPGHPRRDALRIARERPRRGRGGMKSDSRNEPGT